MLRAARVHTYALAFDRAGLAIENLNKRLEAAEKTIAWLKACKENGVCRAAPPGEWLKITPGPDERKRNPDAAI